MRKFIASALLLVALGSSASAATLYSEFTFGSGLTDSQSASTASGSGTVAGGLYAFTPNQGLSVTLGSTLNSWSLVFSSQLSDVNGYRKLVDLSSLALDTGLYIYNSNLNYYNLATGAATVSPNSNFVAALTYDSGTGNTTGYLNGSAQFTFTSPANNGYPGSLSSLIMFQDDTTTNGNEASAGSLDYLKIYDGVLTANELGGMSPVPLPATAPALLAGLAGLAALRRRKRG